MHQRGRRVCAACVQSARARSRCAGAAFCRSRPSCVLPAAALRTSPAPRRSGPQSPCLQTGQQVCTSTADARTKHVQKLVLEAACWHVGDSGLLSSGQALVCQLLLTRRPAGPWAQTGRPPGTQTRTERTGLFLHRVEVPRPQGVSNRLGWPWLGSRAAGCRRNGQCVAQVCLTPRKRAATRPKNCSPAHRCITSALGRDCTGKACAVAVCKASRARGVARIACEHL